MTYTYKEYHHVDLCHISQKACPVNGHRYIRNKLPELLTKFFSQKRKPLTSTYHYVENENTLVQIRKKKNTHIRSGRCLCSMAQKASPSRKDVVMFVTLTSRYPSHCCLHHCWSALIAAILDKTTGEVENKQNISNLNPFLNIFNFNNKHKQKN